jgi:hypothetical protein
MIKCLSRLEEPWRNRSRDEEIGMGSQGEVGVVSKRSRRISSRRAYMSVEVERT